MSTPSLWVSDGAHSHALLRPGADRWEGAARRGVDLPGLSAQRSSIMSLTPDLVCLGLSSIVGVWYLLRKVSSQGLCNCEGGGALERKVVTSEVAPPLPFPQHWITQPLAGLLP